TASGLWPLSWPVEHRPIQRRAPVGGRARSADEVAGLLDVPADRRDQVLQPVVPLLAPYPGRELNADLLAVNIVIEVEDVSPAAPLLALERGVGADRDGRRQVLAGQHHAAGVDAVRWYRRVRLGLEVRGGVTKLTAAAVAADHDAVQPVLAAQR